MKNIYRLLFTFLFLTAISFPQEKIIVLNKIVGERIEKEEAAKYHLFQTIHNFESAVIKQKNSSYFAEVEIWKNSRIADSTFALSYGGILTMAKLIKYNDEVNNGNYNLNKYDIQLFYSDGTPLINNLDTTAHQNTSISENFKSSSINDFDSTSGQNQNILNGNKPSMLWRSSFYDLPFIDNPNRIKFKPSFRWGAAIGVLFYPSNVTGIPEFKEKLKITQLIPEENLGPSFSFVGFLEWKVISFEIEYAGNNEYSKASLGANYLFKNQLLFNFIIPYAGLSVSSIKLNRFYNSGNEIEVSPGIFNTLRGVDIHNFTLGYNLNGGFALDNPYVSFTLGLGYTWVSKIKGSGNSEMLGVDLSGPYFESKFKLFFGEN
jgi:hypothetical protein